MKKTLIIVFSSIIGFVLLMVVTVSLITNIAERQMEDLMQEPVELNNLNELEDGTYIGEVKTIPINVIVEVVIENHQITEIVLIKHRSGQGEAAEVIIDDIVLNQSVNVDTIVGATYSSKAIIIAINRALNEDIDA